MVCASGFIPVLTHHCQHPSLCRHRPRPAPMSSSSEVHDNFRLPLQDLRIGKTGQAFGIQPSHKFRQTLLEIQRHSVRFRVGRFLPRDIDLSLSIVPIIARSWCRHERRKKIVTLPYCIWQRDVGGSRFCENLDDDDKSAVCEGIN